MTRISPDNKRSNIESEVFNLVVPLPEGVSIDAQAQAEFLFDFEDSELVTNPESDELDSSSFFKPMNDKSSFAL